MSQTPDTVVHLLRHGEVHNPDGVLYGRRDGFHLSDLGRQMAEKVADAIKDRDITHLRSSPLERAQETARPLATVRGLEITTDDRVIESTNVFEGERFAGGENALRNPRTWRYLWNPFKPSWGEPYKHVVSRMMAAVHDAREAATGHEAVIVSHQLPIWITRLHVEDRSFLHDPRRNILADSHDGIGPGDDPANRRAAGPVLCQHEHVAAAGHDDRRNAQPSGQLHRHGTIGMSPVGQHRLRPTAAGSRQQGFPGRQPHPVVVPAAAQFRRIPEARVIRPVQHQPGFIPRSRTVSHSPAEQIQPGNRSHHPHAVPVAHGFQQ